MGDYRRSTRECNFEQLRSEIATALRDHIQRYELGDVERGLCRPIGAGPVGAQPASTAQIAGYEWKISLVQPEIIMYSTPLDDIAFIFGLTLPEPYAATAKSPCQQAMEDVMQTFQVVTN